MKASQVVLITLAVIIGGIFLGGGCVYSGYNQAVTLDEAVKGRWAQVEIQLQRRFELIPNLVHTVKGVAGQAAAGTFESALSRLLVLREAYPQLKSNQSFLKLQDQLEGTENRLAVERKRYNDAVREVNTFRRRLLGRFYAGLAGVEQAQYFEVTEAARTAPKVKF